MHRYLRAVGFSKNLNRKEQNDLLLECMKSAEHKSYTSLDDKSMIIEYCKDVAPKIGVCIRGEYDEEEVVHYDYYFPYLRSEHISSYEDITVERHAEKESYAGVCDELRVGVSLIFYLQNMISYLKLKGADRLPMPSNLSLSALSVEGTIMMPIEKTEGDEALVTDKIKKRNRLLAQARNGDEEAIESITLDDMDTYSIISQKIHTEDVYTLVDTFFMPYGVECDQYSVLGEILSCQTVTNSMTKEEVVIMRLKANDLEFDVCINKADLYGEPEIGRRFKGVIWLQGYINYEE